MRNGIGCEFEGCVWCRTLKVATVHGMFCFREDRVSVDWGGIDKRRGPCLSYKTEKTNHKIIGEMSNMVMLESCGFLNTIMTNHPRRHVRQNHTSPPTHTRIRMKCGPRRAGTSGLRMFDRKTCWDRHVHGSAAAAAPSGVAAAEGFPRSFCLPFLQKDVKEGLLASSLMASVIGSLPGRIYKSINGSLWVWAR